MKRITGVLLENTDLWNVQNKGTLYVKELSWCSAAVTTGPLNHVASFRGVETELLRSTESKNSSVVIWNLNYRTSLTHSLTDSMAHLWQSNKAMRFLKRKVLQTGRTSGLCDFFHTNIIQFSLFSATPFHTPTLITKMWAFIHFPPAYRLRLQFTVLPCSSDKAHCVLPV